MTKKIMVVDPGHEEGSRAAEVLCAAQGGVLVVEAKDISPNLNGEVILIHENTSNPLLESIKAFKHQEILESGLQQSRDHEAAVLKENHERMLGLMEDKSIEFLPADGTARVSVESFKSKDAEVPDLIEKPKPAYSAPGSMLGMAMGGMLGALAGGFRRNGGTCPLSEKSSERLVGGTFKQGITHYYCERESGKAWKRRIKKEQQRINHRDRRFRDRTRKLKKLLEYQIKSLKFVFQGPPFGDKDPKISMDRRYAFPAMHTGIIEHIRNNAFNFLGLE